MRYLVALFVAGVIIACGNSFYAFTKTSFVRLLLSEARQSDPPDDATRDRIASLERGKSQASTFARRNTT
ncbi:MAG: hypothetical protein U0795_05190 [Pirellulales bacterium]